MEVDVKATLSDGTVLEGQPSEIAEAIRELGQRTALATNGRLSGKQATSLSSVVWTDEKVRNLWDCLYGKQKDFVRFLVQRGGKASIQDVMKELSLHKGTEVAGLRSCITRNARRETGYKRADLIVWERAPKGAWHYQIVTDALSRLREIVQ